MLEESLSELAVFKGSEFVVAGTAGAQVELLEDRRHIAVTTPAAMWSYGAHLFIDERSLPAGRHLLFRIDLWVTQGTINVGVVGADGQFIVHESRSKVDGRTAVNLFLEPKDRPSQLIVRNSGRQSGKAIIERVQVYRTSDAFLKAASSGVAPTVVSRLSQSISGAFEQSSSQAVELGSEPMVSLILAVKNGLPYLDDALESVRRQSYQNVELVVQDCLSTDGSSERIAKLDEVPVRSRREADGGVGDANNRALGRCRGSIIGSIDSDNLLDRDAVARAVEHFLAHPEHAVVYGSVQMVSVEGIAQDIFRPGGFDFLRLVSCELVLPWSTSFFNRAVCGESLWLDPQLKTCADYDTWLRLSHLPIAFMDCVLGSTRISSKSMTCRPESYEQFCADKAVGLKRYAEKCAHEPLRAALIRSGLVGIYCWAAESIKGLSPDSTEQIMDFYERAQAIDPTSSRLALTTQRLF